MDLIRTSINRPVFITMVTMFMVAIGAITLNRLPVDLYPSVSYPVLSVRANLSGAAPEEIEQLITKRIEDALSTIAGVKTLRSISREGSSIVILEFDTGVDVRFQEMQVRAKIANIRGSLPEAMSEPNVSRQDADDTPVIEMIVTGDRSASELSKLADDIIANRLRQITGVGEVQLSGERKEEVLIELKSDRLETWKIDPRVVVQAIRNFNRNDPIGRLEGEGRVWLLRSTAQAKAATELGTIVVARSQDGNPVFLRDIADIVPGFSEVQRISRAGDQTHSGPSIGIDILKQSGENTVAVSDRVQDVVQDILRELPADVNLKIMRDNADLIRSNVADVFETLVIAAVLTIFVVLIFLRSPRSTLTTGLALPSSVISTFAVMGLFGFSINVMTLLALSLSIGILVDDAIVVRENIFRHLSRGDLPPAEAAWRGAKEVVLAVIATTLVIVAVFLPVGMMSGVSGQFFSQFALTVVFSILVSTWDALTMAPMLSAHFANISDPSKEWLKFGRFGVGIDQYLIKCEKAFDGLERRYEKLLHWILPRPWVAATAGFTAIALSVVGFVAVPKGFLPTQLGDVFTANLNGPLALPLNKVVEAADQVEAKIKTLGSIESWTMRAGSGFTGSANINVTLKVKPEVAGSQDELNAVRQEARKALNGVYPGYNLRIGEPSDPLSGGGGGRFQPVAVLISGPDIQMIRDLARQIRLILLDVPGVADVAPIDDEGLPEIRLQSDAQLAARFNVSPAVISDVMKILVEGDTSNALKLGDDQIPIRVRLNDGKAMSPAALMAMNIHTGNTGAKSDVPVLLGNIVQWQAGAGPTVIIRENRHRLMRIGGSLERGAALGDVVSELQKRLDNLTLPNGYRAQISGQSEQMNELFGNVIWAIILGSIFVYMVLASLFESWLQPLTVMTAIPLAATGAFLALLGTGSALELYSGIGMILLAGIVAKNSILLVDFAMQRVRDEAQDPRTAILNSAPLRMRPILMTSFAMIAGMLPVALGLGSGGAARASLGIATIGGVISSTLLTLLVVPNIYVWVEEISNRFRLTLIG